MNYITDLEHELMVYCLTKWGKWWATHFWPNKEAREAYASLRKLDPTSIVAFMWKDGRI